MVIILLVKLPSKFNLVILVLIKNKIFYFLLYLLMENIILNIDSNFRDKNIFKDPGLFSYKLQVSLKNINSIRLSSIELPTLFYTFSRAYNNLSFKIVDPNGSESIITIEEGNYDSAKLIDKIQIQLDDINNNNTTNYLISFNDINYKVNITNNQAFTLIFDNDANNKDSNYKPTIPTNKPYIFDTNFQNRHYSLGNRLGFTLDNRGYLDSNQGIDINGNYIWEGESFLNVTNDEYLFLRVNDYGVIYNDVRNSALFAKIIIYNNQFVFDNSANFLTKSYEFKQPINISKLEFELVNRFGQTIDMKYMNYSMTLEFNQIYDKNLYQSRNFQIK